MHQQSSRQLQSLTTSLPVSDVLDRAVRFFARGGGVYTAYVEKRGPSHVVLRGQGNEELVIGAHATAAGTMVSGASYLFDQQIALFLNSLPLAPVIVVSDDSATAPTASGAV